MLLGRPRHVQAVLDRHHLPGVRAIGGSSAAEQAAMQQTISVYLIAYAVTSVVHGPLSDAIGRRKVILGGLIVFILGSIGCALATDLTTLLVFRAAGLSSGVGLIVGRAVIRDVLHGDDAQRLMSQGVDDLRHRAGDRADHRRLDPGMEPLAGDFLVLVAFAVLLLLAGGAGCRKPIRPMRGGRWCRGA
jgi:hypothetical protein